jgi:hypothetical protein
VFGVTFVEGGYEVLGGGALASLDEKVGCDIDPGNEAALARERDGEIAGAAG